jgi:hypothetical protein
MMSEKGGVEIHSFFFVQEDVTLQGGRNVQRLSNNR